MLNTNLTEVGRSHLPHGTGKIPLPKFIIECQKCGESVTILYSGKETEEETQDRMKDHLALLMLTHEKNPPETQLPPDVARDKLKQSVRKVRPIP
jgi:hypothetical protein